jgi:hypothetical protein
MGYSARGLLAEQRRLRKRRGVNFAQFRAAPALSPLALRIWLPLAARRAETDQPISNAPNAVLPELGLDRLCICKWPVLHTSLAALLPATSASPTRPAGTIAFDIACVPS